MNSITIDKDVLTNAVIAIFTALGVPEADAALTAEVLIAADQWGVASHGVMRTRRYVDCLRSGGIQPNAAFTVERREGSWAGADANGGLGIPASVKATRLAMELAREYTIGVVNVKRSHHNGMEGYYANLCAQNAMAGFAMSTGNPIMAVTGGMEKAIGNNPFAYALPAGRYGTVMMDIAMSAVADGKVQLAKERGEPLPESCILDRNGMASTEPEDYLSGGGALLPFGGHKGYGLAVMVEVFAGILSGAGLLEEINSWNEQPGQTGNTGHLFIAMDIARMQPMERFVGRIEAMVEKLKTGRRQACVQRILLPGELEQENERKAGRRVKMLQSTFHSLLTAAELAGIKTDVHQGLINCEKTE